jgi:Insertion element 4 transposase N-terminal/Transposase DDE domain
LGSQSAITTLTRTITVAAGVFAPGHLGELTRYLSFELVDAVLAETGSVQRRLRDLPSRVGVYFVLALGLFPRLGYARVWDKLVAGLAGLPVAMPSEKALRDLRRRVGVAPLRALFEAVAGPVAQPHTPGVRYRRYRTVAFDGCSSIKAPDAARNHCWLGRIRHRQAWAGYPTLMLMALVETGTRALLGVQFGAITDDGETGYATRLLPLLKPDMLLLIDRGFDGNDFLTAVAGTGAQFLGRITAQRRPPVLAALPDGSYLTMFAGLRVRIIDATITVTTATGVSITGHYRLATTLLEHRHHPADTLLRLYHERWEIESAFYALRHTILDGHVLRSTDPTGLHQELWALLTVYQALRMTMTTATETHPGADPDRASFTVALEHARNQVINAANILPDPTDPLGVIGRAVLTTLMPSRRARISARKVKAPTSRYAGRRPGEHRPATSIRITTSTHVIHPQLTTPPPQTRYRRDPHGEPTSRKEHVLTLLASQPTHSWHIRDIARRLPCFPNYDTCRAQVAEWARLGIIHRTGPGLYTLPKPTHP